MRRAGLAPPHPSLAQRKNKDVGYLQPICNRQQSGKVCGIPAKFLILCFLSSAMGFKTLPERIMQYNI